MQARRKHELAIADPIFRLGADIGLRGHLYPVQATRNPHHLDYRAYLLREKIHIVGGMEQLLYLRSSKNNGLLGLRRYVHELIDRGFTKESVPLAKAILIGEKTELTETTRTSFARTGLAHVMAVSGMHVGFLVAPFWVFIPWFWRFKMGKLAGLFSIGIILFIYAGITGFSASVIRASLTAVLLAYGKLYHRRRNSINLTAMAALILLTLNPGHLFQIGFQLSFGAVFTILLVWPLIDGKLLNHVTKRWWHPPIQLFLLSLLVQVGLFPLLARYFGEISLIGPIINMTVVLLIGLVVQVGLLGLAITALLPVAG
jgi:competence protein ComEC